MLFKRVLIANRGEIAIRVIRACHELGIRTVAVYTNEDRNALFRLKADEAYQIGKNKGPVEAYLDIAEIIKLAQKKGVDAIHPGYGFLSENAEFAKRCEAAGIVFIGPKSDQLAWMGDKIKSKEIAAAAGIPVVPGTPEPVRSAKEAIAFADQIGYPVIIKASAGGGGRGMRVVRNAKSFEKEMQKAQQEALKAFGSDAIFIEKYLERPKHIEVQILADAFGHCVHLYERDCSIQRRHQKVIEFTPALSLTEEQRTLICQDAVRIAKHIEYINAGTVEFLVDHTGKHYFIEMNPRIQVEHTITENVTGVDLVQSQILIAAGRALGDPGIDIKSQEDIHVNGYSIQLRVTTEDPSNGFMPDTGKLDVYRTGSGFGIRLDGGNGFTGSVISPYYDSLLFKLTAFSRTFEDARQKAIRAVKEVDISGVKTNIPFLINVLNHEKFKNGICDTLFIESHSNLFDIQPKQDQEIHLLRFIGDKVVNETKGNKPEYDIPYVFKISGTPPAGTKQILDQRGPDGLVKWIKGQNKLLLTDTTMRDSHQSLMATRMRTQDMKKIARTTAHLGKDLFSLEMWGGATFDVAYRFLKESPWTRLEVLRERIPNVLFQMLLRGANGVGYKNYPDNVVRDLIKQSAVSGIDVFRIFDSLNWLEGMEVAVDEVLKSGKVAEVALCYTGDILDEKRTKYDLDYYVKKAIEIEKMGAHILAIKDMSALLKPYAAYKLIKALKREIKIPIHLHTHDTSGNGVATLLMAAEAGVDIVDTAFNAMSGLTSQPALNSVVAALKNTERDTLINLDGLQKLSDYWSDVRPVYAHFESELKSSTAEIYKFEIPGGQYSNLKPQVESFGLGHRFEEVKEMYKTVNELWGDIIKVTPSSKAVGDMAIFMVQNHLTGENLLEKGQGLAYPDAVVSYFKGLMGQPEGGFPKAIQAMVLRGEMPITVRPGELLEPVNYEDLKEELKSKKNYEATMQDLISYALYPKVFEDYLDFVQAYGDLSRMGSDVFFHGLAKGETCEVELEEGKTQVIKLLEMGRLDENGQRRLEFEVNGNRRELLIKDKSHVQKGGPQECVIADPDEPKEIGAHMPGKVSKVLVKAGDVVKEGQELIILEAMKMEAVLQSPQTGIVESLYVKEGQLVEPGQLLLRLE